MFLLTTTFGGPHINLTGGNRCGYRWSMVTCCCLIHCPVLVLPGGAGSFKCLACILVPVLTMCINQNLSPHQQLGHQGNQPLPMNAAAPNLLVSPCGGGVTGIGSSRLLAWGISSALPRGPELAL